MYCSTHLTGAFSNEGINAARLLALNWNDAAYRHEPCASFQRSRCTLREAVMPTTNNCRVESSQGLVRRKKRASSDLLAMDAPQSSRTRWRQRDYRFSPKRIDVVGERSRPVWNLRLSRRRGYRHGHEHRMRLDTIASELTMACTCMHCLVGSSPPRMLGPRAREGIKRSYNPHG